MQKTYNVGDRVKLLNLQESNSTELNHGIVVKYRGRHFAKIPRIRWESGWGTTLKVEELTPLTNEELTTLPIPTTDKFDR